MSNNHDCRTGKLCTVQIKNKLSVFKILCWKAFILYEQMWAGEAEANKLM